MDDKSDGVARSLPLSAQEIYQLIQEAAYLRAKARGFAPGVELQDWLEAEKEVWAQLGRPNPAQHGD